MATRSIPVNDTSIAALLGFGEVPMYTIILGRPDSKIKSMKVRKFAKRVQRRK